MWRISDMWRILHFLLYMNPQLTEVRSKRVLGLLIVAPMGDKGRFFLQKWRLALNYAIKLLILMFL